MQSQSDEIDPKVIYESLALEFNRELKGIISSVSQSITDLMSVSHFPTDVQNLTSKDNMLPPNFKINLLE